MLESIEAVPFRFVVLNRAGDRIASAQHIEESTQLLRALPAADRVLDSLTGSTVAYRPTRLHRKLVGVLGVA